MSKQSKEVIIERARSLALETKYTIELQHRRIHGIEPEDEVFVFRKEADIRFFIIALYRLCRIGELLINRVPEISEHIEQSLKNFKEILPGLREMRNVIEHMEEYVIDEGHESEEFPRHRIQCNVFSDKEFKWLGYTVHYDDALKVANQLWESIKKLS